MTDTVSAATKATTEEIDAMFDHLEVDRDRDVFLRELLRELAGVLESTVGIEEAQGFISLVGGQIGRRMNEDYRAGIGVEALDLQQVAGVLVDLKRRIQGGFSIESIDESRIVLVNDACPFAEFVVGRTSLCMMTSNVFGRIAADNLGYAKVELAETIAAGDDRCRVVVHLADGAGEGREYFG